MSVSILVVEDDPEIRNSIRAILEAEGYDVDCVESTDEAKEALNRLPRPCILLWDPTTPRQSLSMVDRATMEGVHVLTLPVSIASTAVPGSDGQRMRKRLTSADAVLRTVREYCPLADAATA
jgi:DNA-binding response OmpR family regulator